MILVHCSSRFLGGNFHVFEIIDVIKIFWNNQTKNIKRSLMIQTPRPDQQIRVRVRFISTDSFFSADSQKIKFSLLMTWPGYQYWFKNFCVSSEKYLCYSISIQSEIVFYWWTVKVWKSTDRKCVLLMPEKMTTRRKMNNIFRFFVRNYRKMLFFVV